MMTTMANRWQKYSRHVNEIVQVAAIIISVCRFRMAKNVIVAAISDVCLVCVDAAALTTHVPPAQSKTKYTLK